MAQSVKNRTKFAQKTLAAAILESSSWFRSCSAATREALRNQGRLRLLAKGETLTSQGDTIANLAVVIDGALAISTSTRTGKRHLVSYLGPGQLMNLIPVLDQQPAIHDAVAHAPTLVFLLHRRSLQAAMRTEPELVNSLLHFLCLRSRLIYASLTQFSLSPLAQRCANTLLILASSYGLPRAEGLKISLKISQEEFADMVGYSRPMVNQELKQLEAHGLIRQEYSQFVILDLEALRLRSRTHPSEK